MFCAGGLSPSLRAGSQVTGSTAYMATRLVWVNFLSIVQSQLCRTTRPCAYIRSCVSRLSAPYTVCTTFHTGRLHRGTTSDLCSFGSYCGNSQTLHHTRQRVQARQHTALSRIIPHPPTCSGKTIIHPRSHTLHYTCQRVHARQ
jgi:hypothetical protein